MNLTQESVQLVGNTTHYPFIPYCFKKGFSVSFHIAVTFIRTRLTHSTAITIINKQLQANKYANYNSVLPT